MLHHSSTFIYSHVILIHIFFLENCILYSINIHDVLENILSVWSKADKWTDEGPSWSETVILLNKCKNQTKPSSQLVQNTLPASWLETHHHDLNNYKTNRAINSLIRLTIISLAKNIGLK